MGKEKERWQLLLITKRPISNSALNLFGKVSKSWKKKSNPFRMVAMVKGKEQMH